MFYFAKMLQVTVVRPANVHDGETQARLFVKGDKIEIEGPGGRFVKKNWNWKEYLWGTIEIEIKLKDLAADL